MIQVLKATGEIEPFSEEKIKNSIRRAGIPSQLQNQVLKHVESKLYDNIPTSEIYRHITEFLGQSPYPYSRAKYSLKEAIMALGPTGYPFEDFVAEILKVEGYQTQVRQILSGICINHEIDVVAQNGDKKIMVEAKFHNSFGTRTDVQDALYTKARFDDASGKNRLSEAWLVTNTKATEEATAYGACVEMKVISWSYPEGESLRDLIEKSRLFLITALTTLTQAQKQQLLEKHIVLCKDIYNNPSLLNILGLSEEAKRQVLAEVEFVLKN